MVNSNASQRARIEKGLGYFQERGLSFCTRRKV